jgi:prolyl oligopeptidase PreP (S9A serine peptidase family)
MKRRKTRTLSETGSSPQEKKMTKSQSSSVVKEKVSLDVTNTDELDAEMSDAGSDVKAYRKACEEIRKLIEEINDLKKEGNKPDVSELVSDDIITCFEHRSL